MKYYLIVGEASGDLHASNLMKALKEQDNQAEFRFFGGDLMSAVSERFLCDYRVMPSLKIEISAQPFLSLAVSSPDATRRI